MTLDLFVPGRICLFGEHSDWAGGYRLTNPEIEKGLTLICGTEQGIRAQVGPREKSLLLTATTLEGERRGPVEIPMVPEVLRAEAERGGFWSYVAGIAFQVQARYPVGGLEIDNTKTDLPIQKGLSSSAAICVLAARAFNRVYDLGLTTRDEMELAYQGEVTTPSRCGRMDQGCAFGLRPLRLTHDGNRVDVEELEVGGEFHLVLVDLKAKKDTVEILARLNECYPAAGGEIARGVRSLFGPINRRIVGEAVEALRSGDARRLGILMSEAQDLFDRYARPACPGELAAPVLHRVLAHEPLQEFVWGGKGVGSQGDGTAQFVARSRADREAAIAVIARDLRMPCLTLTLGSSERIAPTPRGR